MTNSNDNGNGNGSGNGGGVVRRGGFILVRGSNTGAQSAQANQSQPAQSAAGKYDEGEFLVGGGSSTETDKIWARLHEGYIAQVRRIVDSKRFPYRDKSDVYKHAIVRHVLWLDTLEPGAVDRGVLHQLQQEEELIKHEQRKIRFIKHIDLISSVVSDIMEMPGGKKRVAWLLRKLRQHIDQMEDDFYKSYYERMWMDRFGVYLDADKALADLVLMRTNGQEEEESEIPVELLNLVAFDAQDAQAEDDDTAPN